MHPAHLAAFARLAHHRPKERRFCPLAGGATRESAGTGGATITVMAGDGLGQCVMTKNMRRTLPEQHTSMPLDVVLYDATGQAAELRSLVTRPTLLILLRHLN